MVLLKSLLGAFIFIVDNVDFFLASGFSLVPVLSSIWCKIFRCVSSPGIISRSKKLFEAYGLNPTSPEAFIKHPECHPLRAIFKLTRQLKGKASGRLSLHDCLAFTEHLLLALAFGSIFFSFIDLFYVLQAELLILLICFITEFLWFIISIFLCFYTLLNYLLLYLEAYALVPD